MYTTRLMSRIWAIWYLLYLLTTKDNTTRKMVKGMQMGAIIASLDKLAKEIKKYLDSQTPY